MSILQTDCRKGLWFQHLKSVLNTWLTHLTIVCIYASMNRVSIGSDYDLSPIRRRAFILTNAGLLPIEPLGIKFSEISIKIHNISSTKLHPKTSSAKWRPFCSGGNEVIRPGDIAVCWYHIHWCNMFTHMKLVKSYFYIVSIRHLDTFAVT